MWADWSVASGTLWHFRLHLVSVTLDFHRGEELTKPSFINITSLYSTGSQVSHRADGAFVDTIGILRQEKFVVFARWRAQGKIQSPAYVQYTRPHQEDSLLHSGDRDAYELLSLYI